MKTVIAGIIINHPILLNPTECFWCFFFRTLHTLSFAKGPMSLSDILVFPVRDHAGELRRAWGLEDAELWHTTNQQKHKEIVMWSHDNKISGWVDTQIVVYMHASIHPSIRTYPTVSLIFLVCGSVFPQDQQFMDARAARTKMTMWWL